MSYTNFTLSILECFVPYNAQARNQDFFRVGEFSWNQGILKNIHLQHEKEKPRRVKISGLFAWKQGIFSPNQGTFFQFSKKGRGDPPSLSSSSYAPVEEFTHKFIVFLQTYICYAKNKQCQFLYINKTKLTHNPNFNTFGFKHIDVI